MSEPNKLERFKRLSVNDDWPQCFICRENVSAGFTAWQNERGALVVTTICDGCLAKAKKERWIEEK